MASIERPFSDRTRTELVPGITRSDERPRSKWFFLDYIFYVLVAAALVGFGYYLYSFRDTIGLFWPYLLQGAVVTIVLAVISMVLATIFGFIGALGRLSQFTFGRTLQRLTIHYPALGRLGDSLMRYAAVRWFYEGLLDFAPLRWLATVYVEVVRGTPLLVQLLFWYYGIALALSSLNIDPYNYAFQFMTLLQSNSLVPDNFDVFFYGAIGLSFNYGAYLTEVFRSGIQSVDKGQTEASLSLGLSARQVMRKIVLPQAFRITIPPFTNNFITLIQDTALLSVINVVELENATSSFAYPQTDGNIKLFIFVLGALFYLALCYPLALLSRYLEARMAIAY